MKASVIGAGLAGCEAARTLARLGHKVILYEQKPHKFSPAHKSEGFAELAEAVKRETGKNIWCYTGYKFERLRHDRRQAELLQYIDVLVDGPYVESLRDRDVLFRGSRNQRLIDVQASLREGEVVLYAQ